MPKLYLNGSIGFASRDMDHFFNKRSVTYQLAPTVSWPLFQGTQRIQALASARAQLDSGIEQYNQTVLTAVQEVENAMNSYTHIVKQISMLKELVAEGEKTLSTCISEACRGSKMYSMRSAHCFRIKILMCRRRETPSMRLFFYINRWVAVG